jgi:hypothetical protein
LWNAEPTEGDRFVNAEIDWLTSPPGSAVQFQLAGSSPVALSQVVALAVDNAASGADVAFIFPDSGFVLSIPARTSGVWPVFTNALMFYASAPLCILGDRTVFQAFNSMPPPVPVPASQAQNTASYGPISPAGNADTQIIAPTISGTLNAVNISIDAQAGATAGSFQLELFDGTARNIWIGGPYFVAANATVSFPPISIPNLNVRFVNGVTARVYNSSNIGGGVVVVNLYYSQP